MAARKVVVIGDIPEKFRKRIAELKRPVMGVVDKFSGFREALDRGKLAVKVIDLFNQIKADRPSDQSFTLADYARCYDPNVPTHAKADDTGPGYRDNKVYYTLEYMQRSLRAPRGEARTGGGVATDVSARAIATIVQLFENDSQMLDQFWAGIVKEFALTRRRLLSMQRKVKDAKPIISISIPRAGRVSLGNVVHMDRPADATQQTESPDLVIERMRATAGSLAAPGRRIRKKTAA